MNCSASVTLFVLGNGHTEGLIVRIICDDKALWGVIDCCVGRVDRKVRHHTKALLREHGVSELEFVCLTHPHADHYTGMLELLRDEALSIKKVIRYPSLEPKRLGRLMSRVRRVERGHRRAHARRKGALLPANTLERPAVGGELILIDRAIRAGVKAGRFAELIAYGGRSIGAWPNACGIDGGCLGVSATCTGPSDRAVRDYEDQICGTEGTDGDIVWAAANDAINMLSVCIIIVAGAGSMLLCGDTPDRGWEYMLGEMTLPKRISVVKIAHHGSTTSLGRRHRLWEDHIRRELEQAVIGVLAPVGILPKVEALEYLREQCGALYCAYPPKVMRSGQPGNIMWGSESQSGSSERWGADDRGTIVSISAGDASASTGAGCVAIELSVSEQRATPQLVGDAMRL